MRITMLRHFATRLSLLTCGRGGAGRRRSGAIAILLAAFITNETRAALAEGEVDVIVVIDGSGSISSSEFALQRDGLLATVNAPSFLPRDGRISLGIVQFASGARLEVPLTRVDGEQPAQAIVAKLEQIRQVGGGTVHSAGVRKAWDTLLAGARSTARQVVCLATDDGSPDAGLESALADARATPPSLDRFGVLALAPNLEAGLEPFVFGGGLVALTTTIAEVANTLAAMCFDVPHFAFARPMENFELSGFRFGDEWIEDDGTPIAETDADCDPLGPRPFRHAGVDVNGQSAGQAVYASAAGEVVLCQRTNKDGEVMVLEHIVGGIPGVTTVYWHVRSNKALCPMGKGPGATVVKGQQIATVYPLKDKQGRDISHLHFGLRLAPYDPVVSLRGALPPPGTAGCLAKSDRSPLPPFPELFVDPQEFVE